MVALNELDRIWVFNACLLEIESRFPAPRTLADVRACILNRQERSRTLRTLYARELAYFSERGRLSLDMPEPSAGRFFLSVVALAVPSVFVVMPVRGLRRVVRDRRREGAVGSDRAFDEGTRRMLLSSTALLPPRDQERVRAHLLEQCGDLEQAGCSRRRIRAQIVWEVALAFRLWRYVAVACLLRWLS